MVLAVANKAKLKVIEGIIEVNSLYYILHDPASRLAYNAYIAYNTFGSYL